MNEKDKEAFEKWNNDSSSLSSEQVRMFREMNEQERIKFALEQGWQAACEYKQKEIDELEKEQVRHIDILKDEFGTIIKSLQAENEKLRDCAKFYADTGSWYAVQASDYSTISGIISQYDIYEPWGEQGISVGGRRAKEVLKELEGK